MLVRVLTFQIAEPNAMEAHVHMRSLLTDLREQPGLAYAKLARRLLDAHEEMVLIEEWLTPTDLFEWTRGHLERARLPERMPELFDNLVITHYESLDRVADELDLDVIEGDGGEDEGAPASIPA